jgi:hypothetical protein
MVDTTKIGSRGNVGKCICGKEFLIGNSRYGFRRKYCSDACIKNGWRRKNLLKHNLINSRWRENNPDYFQAYNNKNREKVRKYHQDYFEKHYIHCFLDKTMLSKSAHAKGKLLENYIVDRLRASGLDVRARRTYGSGSGLEKGDISNGLNLSIECKNQKKFKLDFWKQCVRDADINSGSPVLVYHLPDTPIETSFAMVEWDYFEKLLVKSKEPPKITEPTRNAKWKGERLRQALKDFMTEMDW